MAIGKCRECGAEVSDEAKTCPKCGVSKPVKQPIGRLGILGIAIVGYVAFQMFSPSDGSSPTQPQQAKAPVLAAAAPAARSRQELVAEMDTGKAMAAVREELNKVCQRVNAQYNHLRVEVRGSTLYCVHDFYSQYSLSAGALAPALESFIVDWQTQLRRLKIKRVGVSGTGEYATSAWYDVPSK